MSTPPAVSTPASPTQRSVITPCTLPEGLTSRMILPSDAEKVLVFLRKRFFRDEPLNMAIQLLEDENDTCKELEEYCMKSIDEGVSTMIVDQDDNLVAVGLNGLNRKEDQVEDCSESCENPKFKKILKLLYKVNNESDIFGYCPDIDVVMDMKIISVDEAYRGKGLAHYLLYKTNEIARAANIRVIRCECSSAFSAKVMQKLDSTKIYTLKYEDYKVDGEKVFTVDPPHTEVGIYYYRY
ncbi:arylalkylamine N-acetyltransferase 1-like isoform X2 [Arctopsyche grandis]